MSINLSKDYKGAFSKDFLEKLVRYSVKRETLCEHMTDTGYMTMYLYTYTNGCECIVLMYDGEIVHAAGK